MFHLTRSRLNGHPADAAKTVKRAFATVAAACSRLPHNQTYSRKEKKTLRGLHRIVGPGMLVITLIAGLGILPAAQASASAVNSSSYRLSARSCTELRRLTIALERQNHVRHRPVDCIVRVRTVTPFSQESTLAHVGLVNIRAAASTSCQGFWRSYSLAYWLSGTVNVGLCSNGSSTWSNWGPDCGVNMWPIYAWEFITNVTWCGVYNNHGTIVQPGENFTLNPYATPWWPWYKCWVRFTAGPSGGGVGMNYGSGGC